MSEKKKKNKTDHLQLEKDEDKEEAGVQIKPHTARCPQNGPPVPAVSTVMPHEVSAPAHPPPLQREERAGGHHLTTWLL